MKLDFFAVCKEYVGLVDLFAEKNIVGVDEACVLHGKNECFFMPCKFFRLYLYMGLQICGTEFVGPTHVTYV